MSSQPTEELKTINKDDGYIAESYSNLSEKQLTEIFNKEYKGIIEHWIKEDQYIPEEYKKEFSISDLGELHVNMEAEHIYFDNPIPGYGMYVTVEFDKDTAELTSLIIDG